MVKMDASIMPIDHINCSILQRNSELSHLFNINHFDTSTISNMDSGSIHTQLILSGIIENNEHSSEELNINLHPILSLNTNDNVSAEQMEPQILSINDSENILSGQIESPILSMNINENVLPEQIQPQILSMNTNENVLSEQIETQKLSMSINENILPEQIEPLTLSLNTNEKVSGDKIQPQILSLNSNENVLFEQIEPQKLFMVNNENILSEQIEPQILSMSTNENVSTKQIQPQTLSLSTNENVLSGHIEPPIPSFNTNQNVTSVIRNELDILSLNENVFPKHELQCTFSETENNRPAINHNILLLDSQNVSKMQSRFIQNTIPEEQLTIDIGSDTEETHSWRPNLTNSLSSDFFLTQPVVNSETVDQFVLSEDPLEQLKMTPPPFLWHDDVESKPHVLRNDVLASDTNFHSDGTSPLQVHIQNHVLSQKAQMNTIKYEAINAQRKACELKNAVEMLTCEWKEKILLQNSPDMQKLRDSNAELRIECQCLCMEVDYYLKGQAPLGEVDETFYHERESHNGPMGYETNTVATQRSCDSKQQEELNRWECPKCTFANHPDITSCEMCQMERVRKQSSHFPISSTDSCYCHPKENTCS